MQHCHGHLAKLLSSSPPCTSARSPLSWNPSHDSPSSSYFSSCSTLSRASSLSLHLSPTSYHVTRIATPMGTSPRHLAMSTITWRHVAVEVSHDRHPFQHELCPSSLRCPKRCCDLFAELHQVGLYPGRCRGLYAMLHMNSSTSSRYLGTVPTIVLLAHPTCAAMVAESKSWTSSALLPLSHETLRFLSVSSSCTARRRITRRSSSVG